MDDKRLSDGDPELEEAQRESKISQQLLADDLADPVRAQQWRHAQRMHEADLKSESEENPELHDELHAFLSAFAVYMSEAVAGGAGRYRLYHALVGSTPPGVAESFDAEGEWSLASKVTELAEKYHLSLD